MRFQSNGNWAETDWSNEADRAVGSSRLACQSPKPVARPAAFAGRRLPDQAGQPGHAGVEQDPVDVDPAQAGAEAVVADGHDRGAPAVGQLAKQADGRRQGRE